MIAFVRLGRVDSPTLTRVLRQAAMQWLALLMVMGLALTSLGPMLDHHFAERHAGHQHLYLGQVSPEHSHAYQHSHAHDGVRTYGPLAPARDGEPSGDIVFLMPNDGTGHSAADMAVPAAVQPLRFGGGERGPILRTSSNGGGVLTGIVVAPSMRPPRA